MNIRAIRKILPNRFLPSVKITRLITITVLISLTGTVFLFSNADVKKDKLPPNSIKLYLEDFKDLLMMAEKTVKMPLDEYNTLLDAIRRSEEERKKEDERQQKLMKMTSSEKYSFTGGMLDCYIERDTVTIEGSFNFNLLKEGWKNIRISSLPRLEEILLDGKPAFVRKNLESNDTGEYDIISEKTGAIRIGVRFHPEISQSDKGNRVYYSYTIESNQRGPVNVKIRLPKGAEPSPSIAQDIKFEKKDGIYTALRQTDFTEPLMIEWFLPKGKIDTSIGRNFSGGVLSYYIIDEKNIRYIAIVRIEPIGETPGRVELQLPEGLDFRDSETPANLDLTFNPIKKTVVISLPDVYEEMFQFIVYCESPLKEGKLPLEPAVLNGAQMQYGYIAAKGEGVMVKTESAGSYDRLDTRLLPPELCAIGEADPDIAFKYNITKSSPSPAVLAVLPAPPAESLSAYIRNAKIDAVLSNDGVLITEMDIALINNNKQFLRISLPDKSEVQSAFVDDKPVRPVASEDAGSVLIPVRPKESSRDGLVKVGFVYRSLLFPFQKEGIFRLNIPGFDVPLNTAVLQLFLPENYEYDDFRGSFKKGESAFIWSQTGRGYEKTSDVSAVDVKRKIPEQENIPTAGGYIQQAAVTGALPVKVQVPKTGRRFAFYDFLIIKEQPFIEFQYEEE